MLRGCLVFHGLCMSLVVMAVCVVFVEQLSGGSRPCDGRMLSLCVVVTEEEGSTSSTGLFLDSLNFAFYPQGTTVELFVVVVAPGPAAVPSPQQPWLHGPYHHSTDRLPLKFDARSLCLIVLEDTMEVSPVFIHWFSYACARDRIVSGGEAGLALPGDAWARFVAASDARGVMGELAGFIAAQNLTVVRPELEDGYTFVRARRQSPMQPEQRPKLARAVDERYLAAGS